MYPISLLTLPPELRCLILEMLFYGAELSTLCRFHRPNPFQCANYGILAANKQLHREASTILFHSAVLRLNMPEGDGYIPRLATKTVIPVWSWHVRDRYRDNGTDLEFLQRWQGLKKVRHVEMSLPFKEDMRWLVHNPEFRRDWESCEMAVGFLNGLPEVESLTVYTDDDDDDVGWVEKCKEKLRALKFARFVVLARDGSCGHQP